jgi:enoyl-CoA hydratase
MAGVSTQTQPPPSSGRIELLRDGPVATIVLDHPERRNAVSVSMWRGLGAACAELKDDPEVRAVIVRGSGETAFVSGADISEFRTVRSGADAERSYGEVSGRGFAAVAALPQPVIALIHGFCIGGGVALSLACDLRYAADDARFAIPAARLGLGYGTGGLQLLIDVVGPSRAKEIFFTARRYGAREALELGLVNRVFPKADLDGAVAEIAAGIGSNAPLTIRAVKSAVREILRDPGQRDMAKVQAEIDACFDSEDYKEGVRAFLEKRPARFQGK